MTITSSACDLESDMLKHGLLDIARIDGTIRVEIYNATTMNTFAKQYVRRTFGIVE